MFSTEEIAAARLRMVKAQKGLDDYETLYPGDNSTAHALLLLNQKRTTAAYHFSAQYLPTQHRQQPGLEEISEPSKTVPCT